MMPIELEPNAPVNVAAPSASSETTDYAFGSQEKRRNVVVISRDGPTSVEEFDGETASDIEALEGYFGAARIHQYPTTLPDAVATTFVLALPPQIESDRPRHQWQGFIRFKNGSTVKLSFIADFDDSGASGEYARLLGSLRRTTPREATLAASRAIDTPASAKSLTVPVRNVSLEVGLEYHLPPRFRIEGPDHRTFLLSAPVEPDRTSVADADGRKVEVQIMANLWERRPSAKPRFGASGANDVAAVRSERPGPISVRVPSEAGMVELVLTSEGTEADRRNLKEFVLESLRRNPN